MTSGLKGLLVIKTTGSGFQSFVRDEYTTLVEVDDRIFATSIDLTYTFAPISIPRPADGEGKVFAAPFAGDAAKGTPWDGDALAAALRTITLEVFALDESASVQVRRSPALTVGRRAHSGVVRRPCTRWASASSRRIRTLRT